MQSNTETKKAIAPAKGAYQTIERIIVRLTRALTWVGMAATIVMMLLIVTDAALRGIFNKPIMGGFEVVTFLLAIVVFSVLAWAEVEDSHTSMPLLFDRLPKKAKPMVKLIMRILGFASLVIISWRSVAYAGQQQAAGYVSAVLHIPTYFFIYFVAVGTALYALVVLLNIWKSLEGGRQ